MWLNRFYPELLLLPSDAERRIVVSQAKGRVAIHWPRLCASIVAIILGGFSFSSLAEAARFSPLAAQLTVWVPISILSVFAIDLFWNRPMHLQIRRVLNERGIPVCLRCGYSLTGLPEPRCPECGEPFEPQSDAR